MIKTIIVITLFIFFIFICNLNETKTVENFVNYYISKSNIHGRGVFANKNFKKDEKINIVFYEVTNKDSKIADITAFGKMINHCENNNNTYLKKEGNTFYLVAKKNINKGDEFTIDYNNTPDYIAKPKKNYKKC